MVDRRVLDGERIDLNDAKPDDLSELIGDEQAEALFAFREEHGPFRSWEDLSDIPGFDDRTVDVVRRSATLGQEEEEDDETLFVGTDDPETWMAAASADIDDDDEDTLQ
jgi:competence ComEA-like helix-hairpin-helix protein